MITAVSILIILVTVGFTVSVREKDLPPPVPENPFRYLDERKARIYEGLRDLQFEFRVGKLSEVDYQSAKQSLQKELANVLSEVEELKARLAQPEPAASAKKKGKPA